MTPWRSPGYLRLAAHQPCIKCGAQYCVSAHYSGLMSHKVGKGGSQKCADIVSAHLCDKCHKEFDLYVNGNDDARAVDFLLLCWQTLLRNLAQGLIAVALTPSAEAAPDVPLSTGQVNKPFRKRKPLTKIYRRVA